MDTLNIHVLFETIRYGPRLRHLGLVLIFSKEAMGMFGIFFGPVFLDFF